jgi:hypothetical protein
VKVFVFASNRYDSMTTSLMLETEGIDHTVLVHTEEQREGHIKGGTVREDRLVVTNQPAGLAYNRNAALDLMEDGEWAVFLVDDLKSVSELAGYDETYEEVLDITLANQNEYAKRFKNPISMKQFLLRCEQGARYCSRIGSHLLGFAGVDNAPYRRNKWGMNILADGRAWALRKSHLRFDTNVQTMDDYCWCALNLREFGVVVVNQWILPDCKRYTPGGCGTKEERMPRKIQEAKYLVETYPEFIAYKSKKGWPEGSHITLRHRRPKRST